MIFSRKMSACGLLRNLCCLTVWSFDSVVCACSSMRVVACCGHFVGRLIISLFSKSHLWCRFDCFSGALRRRNRRPEWSGWQSRHSYFGDLEFPCLTRFVRLLASEGLDSHLVAWLCNFPSRDKPSVGASRLLRFILCVRMFFCLICLTSIDRCCSVWLLALLELGPGSLTFSSLQNTAPVVLSGRVTRCSALGAGEEAAG